MRRAMITGTLAVLLLGTSCENAAREGLERPDIVKTATAYAQAVKTRLAAVTATATVTATPKPAPTMMVVANTGGMGVYIRRTPVMADRIKAWVDGTVMKVTGEETEAEGRKWLRAEDPDGNLGWIPAEYLAPRNLAP